jgi:hypothetical protein
MRFREFVPKEEYTGSVPQQFRLQPTSTNTNGKQTTQAGANIANYTPDTDTPNIRQASSVVAPTYIDNRMKSADIMGKADLGNGNDVGGSVSVAKGKGVTGVGVNATRQFDTGASLSADLSTDPRNLRSTTVNANLKIPFSS